jgi:hypothetical protein
MNIANFLTSCDGKWRRAEPASSASIVALVEKSGLELPTDYLSFLTQCNGGDGFLKVQPCYLRVWNAEVVVDYNLTLQRWFAEFGKMDSFFLAHLDWPRCRSCPALQIAL